MASFYYHPVKDERFDVTPSFIATPIFHIAERNKRKLKREIDVKLDSTRLNSRQ